jgi:hypothetical protein
MTDRAQFLARQATYMRKDMYAPGKGEDLTIKDCRVQVFTSTKGDSDEKLVLDWREDRPPLALNRTNAGWLVSTFGPDDEAWMGKRVHVFHDAGVRFGGRAVGGLVIEQAHSAPAAGSDPALKKTLAAPARPTPEPKELSDDIPF